MSSYTTKYAVGDKVYIVHRGSLVNDVDIELDEIRSLSIGQYGQVQYQFRLQRERGDTGIYTDLDEVKKAAIKLIKERAKTTIERIENKTLADVSLEQHP